MNRNASILAIASLAVLALITAPASAADSPALAALAPAAYPAGPHGGFIENRGQWDSPARFAIPGSDAAFAVDGDGLALWILAENAESANPPADTSAAPACSGVHLRLDWLGASDGRRLVGLDRRPGIRNYLLGRDRAKWATHVPAFARVASRGLYDGIDLVLRTDEQGRVAYDLVLAPGADPRVVEIAVRGADGLSIRPDGSLAIATALGEVLQTPPRTWQVTAGGERREVASRFALRSGDTFGFEVPEPLDPALALVVDPALEFWTYIGGSGFDSGNAICVGANDEPIFVGHTQARDVLIPFPATPGAFQNTLPVIGALGFVARLTVDASALVYSTYIGGSGLVQEAAAIYYADLLPSTQEVFFAGLVSFADFPTTPGAYDETFDPGPPFFFEPDVFAARLAADGSDLIYSTFLGTSSMEYLEGLILHEDGRLTLFGETEGQGFPTTPGAYQPQYPGGGRSTFITQFVPDGSALSFSTFLGGTSLDDAKGIALASDGTYFLLGMSGSANFPITPQAYDGVSTSPNSKCFVARMDATGSAILASTYLPGFTSHDIVLDPSGDPILVGSGLGGLPTTPGAYSQLPFADCDAAIVRMDAGLSQVEYGTYLGGSLGLACDQANFVARGPGDTIVVVGHTNSTDFPTTPDAFDATLGSTRDIFLCWIDPALSGPASLLYSTYLGGDESDNPNALRLDSEQRVIIAADTTSLSLPTTPGAFQSSLLGWKDATFLRIRLVGVAFRRGDINADGAMNIADAVALLGSLFSGGSAPTCHDAADANDDGAVDVADAVSVLGALFLPGSPQPPAPGAAVCGIDPTADSLGCAGASGCP